MIATIEVTSPGIYTIPEEEYHADPVPGGSLSRSGATKLLDCPAKFAYDRVNPPAYKDVFDFGHAAHTLVLGVGAPVEVLPFDDRRTKACKEAIDEARMYGRTPILAKDWEIVEAMAAEIRRHPLASALLNPEHGKAEQSLFWRDERTGLMLRCRVDWLPDVQQGRRFICTDYKTAVSSEPTQFAKAVANYEYHMQDAWYSEAVSALLGVVDPAFLFIVQEKTAPYVVTVIELSPAFRAMGAERNRAAIDLFVECSRTDVWPGYATAPVMVEPPKWLVYQHDEEYGDAQF